MSGFAQYRSNQKALEHGLTKEGGSVWEKANQEFIKENWDHSEKIYSEKFPAADIDADYDEFTDKDLHQRLVNAGWPKDKIEEIKGVMKGSRLNREAAALANKTKKPTPPPILRYPYEGMTQHTDYLQIDIVQYKPVGKERAKEGSGWGTIGTEIIKGTDGTEYTNKIAGKVRTKEDGARFTGKMGGRRNSRNRIVGNTRSYALSTRPLKNEGTILLPIPSNVQDGNSVKVGDNSLN